MSLSRSGTTYVEYEFRLWKPFIIKKTILCGNRDMEYEGALKLAVNELNSGVFFDEHDLECIKRNEYTEFEKKEF
jgi:hypothetical protein